MSDIDKYEALRPDSKTFKRLTTGEWPQTVPVSGLHLRTIGERVQLLAEVEGEWRLVIDERNDGPISHIVEPSGIASAPARPSFKVAP